MMSTILCLAEQALARVKQKLKIDHTVTTQRANKLRKAVLSLKTENGYYAYLNALTDEIYHVRSLGALFPHILEENTSPDILQGAPVG